MRGVAEDRPVRKSRLDHRLREDDLARHLPEVAVREKDDRVAVLERELERQSREVEHLLRRRGREDDRVRVAVAEAAARELDVGLLGRDVAESRAAAHHVDEDARHLGADHVGDPFQHQAEARRGRERHAGQPRAAAAVHHVDGRDLADRLEEDAVELRQELRHELGAFRRRRDRVSEDVPAAREERADRGRVVPLQDERLRLREGDDLGRDRRGFRRAPRRACRRASPGPAARSPRLSSARA